MLLWVYATFVKNIFAAKVNAMEENLKPTSYAFVNIRWFYGRNGLTISLSFAIDTSPITNPNDSIFSLIPLIEI